MSGLARPSSLLPTPFFPFGEGFTPPPTPSPGPWREGFAGRWSAQDGPRWLQEGLREPKMASKIAQDSPTWLKIAHNMPPRGSKTASRRLQEAKEPPKEAPERPKSFKNLKKINDLCLLAFSLPMAFRGLKMAPRWPKRAPRGAQESPKTAPRAPKSAPRAPQEGSRRRF